MNELDGKSNVSSNSWEVFLRRARDWLLAYSLLSILPATLANGSSQSILEAFKDSLDVAFTPLWGRFFHHLNLSLDVKSKSQIIWTFSYAKSFIEMLLNLVAQITQAEQMNILAKLDYLQAAQMQIVEKANRFLRAHLARILTEELDPWENQFGMQIMEETLEFDDWLGVYASELRISDVFYDAKEAFHSWMHLEQSLIFTKLEECIKKEGNAFDLILSHLGDGQRQINCYKILYELLSMFLLARERYSYFPKAAQIVLSDVILEPLLCFSLASLLFRIRSVPLLYDISMQKIDRSKSNQRDLSELVYFGDSVTYFQNSIGREGQRFVHGSSKRCRNRWTVVQNWMPKILITNDLKSSGFGMTEMMKLAMKISDKYSHRLKSSAQGFEYRQQVNAVLSGQSKEIEVDSIEESVVLVRGLAITLVNLLEGQYATS